MFTSLTRGAPRLGAATWLRRITAVLTAVTGCVLAWATVPAASAAIIPIPDGPYRPAPATAGGTTRVITAGGMPGWQITLIALAAALAAATAAVFLDHARASRRAASTAG
jgi:hypothetical protein